MPHPVWSDPLTYLPAGFGALPMLAQLAGATPDVSNASFGVACLSALVVIVRSIADPISLRRQVKILTATNVNLQADREALRADRDSDRREAERHHRECRDEVHTLRDEVNILNLALRRALNESPREYVARDQKTEDD